MVFVTIVSEQIDRRGGKQALREMLAPEEVSRPGRTWNGKDRQALREKIIQRRREGGRKIGRYEGDEEGQANALDFRSRPCGSLEKRARAGRLPKRAKRGRASCERRSWQAPVDCSAVGASR